MSDTKTHRIPPRLLARLALLAALSAVLKLLQVPVAGDYLRISFENLPILLSGYLFGPVPGAAVGMCADLVGCLLYGYAPNPVILLGAGTIGCLAGLLGQRGVTAKPQLWLAVTAAHLVGSLIVKSFGIWLYFATPLPQLALRIPTYLLTGTAEFLLLTLILKNKVLRALLEKI